MDTLLYISASIALLALAGLFIYLIILFNSTKGLLNSVTSALQGIIGEITAIRGSLQGTITNIEGITGKVEGTVDRLNDSMERVNSQLDQVEGIVESVKVMTEDVSRLTTDATDVIHDAKGVVVGVIGMVDTVQSSVQKPVNELMTIFSALGTGIRKFRMKLGGAGSSHRSAAGGSITLDKRSYSASSTGQLSDGQEHGETVITQVTHTAVIAGDDR